MVEGLQAQSEAWNTGMPRGRVWGGFTPPVNPPQCGTFLTFYMHICTFWCFFVIFWGERLVSVFSLGQSPLDPGISGSVIILLSDATRTLSVLLLLTDLERFPTH